MNRVVLARVARMYRTRRTAAAGSLALGVCLLLGGTLHWAGAGNSASLAPAVLGGLLCMIACWWRDRAHRVTPAHVARHLNRVLPELEESAELLLHEAEGMPLIARLERGRVEAALSRSAAVAPPQGAVARQRLLGALGTGALGTLLLLLPHRGGGGTAVPHLVAGRAGGAPAIGNARIVIQPPAYTGLRPREQREWDLDVPAGASITWHLAAAADTVWLVTSDGDTTRMGSAADGFATRLTAARSVLYEIVGERAGKRVVSEFHRMAVQLDAPPAAAIEHPSGRTSLGPGAPLRVTVVVHATDDYGVGSGRLIATLTSGEGEAVKFREESLPLGPLRDNRFQTSLDLPALGLKPGDELYFHAEVSDRRTPAPNVGRSETVFISLTDSAHTPAAPLAGLALRLAPEFFRSERQIILDTEKLLADRPRISLETFRNRSNDIGLDQELLRNRYGQFVGDESESGESSTAGHQHDTPENATLLAASVKAKLKDALAQMWEAGLRLRTYRPAEALPFEYRALDFLKQAQQSARVYVQKVGFEPPPLDPARTRLSGKLDAIAGRSDRDSVTSVPTLPAVRAAIAALSALGDRTPDAAALDAIRAAESELAPLAATDARQLATIRWLRATSDSARAGHPCQDCVARALPGLLLALPESNPLPQQQRPAETPLSRRYFDRLDAAR